MDRRTRRLAMALALAAALLTAPPAVAQDTGDGTLVVQAVDQYGNPRPSTVLAVNSRGDRFVLGSPDGRSFPAPTLTHTESLPPGDYALAIVTDWGGLVCAGFTSCTPDDFAPVPLSSLRTFPFEVGLTVVAGQTVSHTASVTIPRVEGTGTVGSTLSVVPSPGVAALDAWPTASEQTVTWVGDRCCGGLGPQYTVTRLDGGKAIAAHIYHSTSARNFLHWFGFGNGPGWLTTNAIQIAPAPPRLTTTTMRAPAQAQRGARVSIRVKVREVGVPTTPSIRNFPGRVRVTVGSWSKEVAVRFPQLSVATPKLKAGRWTVTATYLGHANIAASSAPTRTIRVTKPRKR